MVLGSSWEEGWRRGRRAGFILGVPVGAALVLVTLALASCGEESTMEVQPMPRVAPTVIPRLGAPPPPPAVRGSWARLDTSYAPTFYRFHDEERGVTCYLVSNTPPACFPDSQLLPASVEAR